MWSRSTYRFQNVCHFAWIITQQVKLIHVSFYIFFNVSFLNVKDISSQNTSQSFQKIMFVEPWHFHCSLQSEARNKVNVICGSLGQIFILYHNTYGPLSSRIASSNFSSNTLLFGQMVTAGNGISETGKLLWRMVVIVGKLIHFITIG